MRCSVSPFARASAVCILMQLAQPLIWEARISTSPISVGSRLEAMAIDVRTQFFMSSGAAAKGSSLAVMVRLLLSVPTPRRSRISRCDIHGNILVHGKSGASQGDRASSSSHRLFRPAAEIVDQADLAARLARKAGVAAMQNEPVMRVQHEFGGDHALKTEFHFE